MKNYLLILITIVFSLSVYANPKVEYGPNFDISGSGAMKILQLKNGNTLFFHFSKQGIEVTVYDSKRDVIAKKTLTSDIWDASKMPYSSLEGLYEINSQPVIFLSQNIGSKTYLFRIILDPNTGEILKEKQLESFDVKANYNFFTGSTTIKSGLYFVEKDPYSDYYAIAYYDALADNVNEMVRVVHYNGMHKKLGAGYLELPKDRYKYINFIALTVIGEKQVNICTYGYNSKKDKGEDSRVILSKLVAGDSSFTSKELDFSEDFKNTMAIMKYNKGTGMLNLLTLTTIRSKRNETFYLALINYIDPATLYVTATSPVTAEKASAYMQSHLDVDAYQGLPQDMIVNPDNTITILMEETRQETITRNGAVVSMRTYLGNIGVTVMDGKGKEKEGAAILKMQSSVGLLNPLYLSYKCKGLWSYNENRAMLKKNYNAYLSFDYVSTANNRYILFNDRPENFDRDEKKKRKLLEAPNTSNTICYKLNKGDMEKNYLFGEPDDRQYKFCDIESSNYMPETNTYATMVVIQNGHDEEAHIAWVKFE